MVLKGEPGVDSRCCACMARRRMGMCQQPLAAPAWRDAASVGAGLPQAVGWQRHRPAPLLLLSSWSPAAHATRITALS